MDPNILYKQSFRGLTEGLGRIPGVKDKEWLVLHDNYKRGWTEHEGNSNLHTRPPKNIPLVRNVAFMPVDGRKTPTPGVRPLDSVLSMTAPAATTQAETPAAGRPVLDAREGGGGETAPSLPLTNPGRGEMGEDEESTGEAGNVAVRGAERPLLLQAQDALAAAYGLTVGSRGPNGGIMARCEECSGIWERAKQRGRPSRKCGECR